MGSGHKNRLLSLFFSFSSHQTKNAENLSATRFDFFRKFSVSFECNFLAVLAARVRQSISPRRKNIILFLPIIIIIDDDVFVYSNRNVINNVDVHPSLCAMCM